MSSTPPRRILCALAPVGVLRREVDEIDASYESDEEYLGAFRACALRDTIVGEIDDGLVARVTSDVERDARIAPLYKQLGESALTVALTELKEAGESIVMREVPSELTFDLPIVFPRLEFERTRATLGLTIKPSSARSARTRRMWPSGSRGARRVLSASCASMWRTSLNAGCLLSLGVREPPASRDGSAA